MPACVRGAGDEGRRGERCVSGAGHVGPCGRDLRRVYASRAGTPRGVWSEVVPKGKSGDAGGSCRRPVGGEVAWAGEEQWKELPGSVCFYLRAESTADGLWGRSGPPGVWFVLTLREAGRGVGRGIQGNVSGLAFLTALMLPSLNW